MKTNSITGVSLLGKTAIGLSLALLLFAGCNPVFGPDNMRKLASSAESETVVTGAGTVAITVRSAAAGLNSDVSLQGFTVISIEVTASREGYTDVVTTLTYDSDAGAWTGTMEELDDGEWLFTARALDDSSNPVVLFSGSALYTVTSGTLNELSIDLLEEVGVIQVDASWSVAGAVDQLVVTAEQDNFSPVVSQTDVLLGALSARAYSLDLAAGEWSITVTGYTSGEQTFQATNGSVTVTSGGVTVVSPSLAQIAVTPLFASPETTTDWATSLTVTLDTRTPGVTISYTVDGSDPASSGTATIAAAPASLLITETTTIRAFGSATGIADSTEQQFVYTVVGTSAIATTGYAQHSALIKSDGSLWLWGSNSDGQLGLGDTTTRTTPVRLGSESWSSVSLGDFHSVAIRSDGTLWAWGYNSVGQLGNGTTSRSLVPVQEANGFTDWVAVSAGASHNLALRNNSGSYELYAWGNGSAGRLGNGATSNVTIPQRIGTDTNWAEVSAGYDFSFALKSDGSRYAWGQNNDRQLGLGDTSSYLTVPTADGTYSDWVTVDAGNDHGGGIRSEEAGQTLWVWGSQSHYRIGTGDQSSTDLNAPTQIATSISNWVQVSFGYYHGLALTATNDLYVWGDNDYGRLGTGGLDNEPTPVQIGSTTNWTSIQAGETHSLALRDD